MILLELIGKVEQGKYSMFRIPRLKSISLKGYFTTGIRVEEDRVARWIAKANPNIKSFRGCPFHFVEEYLSTVIDMNPDYDENAFKSVIRLSGHVYLKKKFPGRKFKYLLRDRKPLSYNQEIVYLEIINDRNAHDRIMKVIGQVKSVNEVFVSCFASTDQLTTVYDSIMDITSIRKFCAQDYGTIYWEKHIDQLKRLLSIPTIKYVHLCDNSNPKVLEVQPNFARGIIFNIYCYNFSKRVLSIELCRSVLLPTYAKRILEKFQRVKKLLGFSRRRVLENGSNGILWEISMKMLHFHDFDR